MSYYIHAAKFFLKNVTEIGGYLEVTDDGKFGEYLPETAKPDGDIVEQSGKLIAPGLVDTHIHGLLGHDVMDNDWDGIETMSKNLLKAGVTSWLTTRRFDRIALIPKNLWLASYGVNQPGVDNVGTWQFTNNFQGLGVDMSYDFFGH
ncbi:N-acetylglucosamine-6-phosphate deacetylase [Lacticaseibacillus paracasei subsp. tolerans DSM 20258]|nr:N-acetylglucosamine-6-phosphate deacetylase [Lacticaseibacillus paracasei subsp. tolerans DSM 20258]GEL37688.1 hypothetical protein LPA06_05390 [Lacticaseibacillus paracasei subsp. tolerans]